MLFLDHLYLKKNTKKRKKKSANHIDDVTCDVMPGSMRMHHNNIHCYFAQQFVHASCLVRACAFKTLATLHKPCSEP